MTASASTTGNRIWTAIAALLALHMLTTPFAAYLQLADHGPTWYGLDDSARMALNWAWKSGINWGHDMVYTYGPLSFLSTKVGWGVSSVALLLSDLFVVVNFFFVFRDFILSSRYRGLSAFTILLITLVVPVFYGSGLAWVLTIFIYYWMWRSYSAPKAWHFGILALLITLAFYLKLNTGLFTIVFLLGHLGLLALTRKIPLAWAGFTLAGLAALIGIGALAFNVSLPAYIKGATEVVKGYNDLLYLYEEHHDDEQRILWLFWGMSAVLGAGCLLRLRQRDWTAAFLLLISIGYLFLLKKQAIFRNDQQHLGEFFGYAPLVWLSGVSLLVWPRRREIMIGLGGAFTLACLLFGAGERPLAPIGAQAASRYTVVFRYAKEVANYDPKVYANQADKRILPPRVFQRIGRETVDVFPWDANYALQNDLNYHPRPCFQTFQANSDYLQRLNYDFYLQRGPRFVLYDYDGIDNAYPFNDAPTMNLFLARNYRVADSFISNDRWRILLERKPIVAPINLTQSATTSASLDAPVAAMQGDYMKLQVTYTLRGKVRAFWHKPAPLQIAYQRPNGEWLYHKTSTELLKTGIYTGYLIRSNQDFARFVSGDTAGMERIRAIKLVGDPDHYKNSFEIAYFNSGR